MPKNVVLWDGTVVGVPDEVAAQLDPRFGRGETTAEAGETARSANESARHGFSWGDEIKSSIASGLTMGVSTFVPSETINPSEWRRQVGEGAYDTASFGAYGRGRDMLSGDQENYAQRFERQANPGARFVGEIGAIAANPGNVLGDTGAIQQLAGKWAGRGIEGAMLGAGAHVANSNVTGDPLTVEGTVESMGIGAVLGLGTGALADGLGMGAQHARKLVQRSESLASDFTTVKAAEKLFEGNETYQPVVDAYNAARKTALDHNREATRLSDAYTEFLEPKRISGALRNLEAAENDLRARVQSAVAPQSDMAVANFDRDALPQIQEALATIRQARENARLMMRSNQFESAVEAIRYGQDRALKSVPDLDLTELPAPPTMKPVPVPEADWGKDLRAFAKQKGTSVEKISAAAQLDASTTDAFRKLAADIGVRSDLPPADLVNGVWNQLSSALPAYERLTAEAEREASKPLMYRLLKKALTWGVSRLVDTGGVLGTIKRVGASFAAGRVFDTAEDAIAGSLLAGKDQMAGRVTKLVSEYGGSAARGVQKLGPVTAYLANTLHGERDPERDIRKRARNRVDEIVAASGNAPDSVFAALQPLMGLPDDIALKLHQHITGALNYLKATAPKDPGTDVKMFRSNWMPSHHDAIQLSHRLEAVLNPIGAAARVLAGQGHESGVEALWATHPAMMNRLANEVAMNAEQLQTATYDRAKAFGQLFRTALASVDNPFAAQYLQSLYLPASPSSQASPSAPSPSSAASPGRPPAYSSQVAGSNVSTLLQE